MSNIFVVLFVYTSIFPFIGLPIYLFPADIQPLYLVFLFPALISLRKLRITSSAHQLMLLLLAPVLFFPLVVLAEGFQLSTSRVLYTFLLPPVLFLSFSSLKPSTIFSVLNKSSILILVFIILQLSLGRDVVNPLLFRSISEIAAGRGLTSLFPEPSFLVTQCTFILCILTLFVLSNPLLIHTSCYRTQFLSSVLALSVSVALSLSVTAIYYFLILLLAIIFILSKIFMGRIRWLSRPHLFVFTILVFFLSISIAFYPYLSSLTSDTKGIRLLELLPSLLDLSTLLSFDLSAFTRAVSFCSSTIYLFHNPLFLNSSSLLSLPQLSFCEQFLSPNSFLYTLSDSPYNPLLFYSSIYGILGLLLILLFLSTYIYSLRHLFASYSLVSRLFLISFSLAPFLLQTSPLNPIFWLYLFTPPLFLSRPMLVFSKRDSDLDYLNASDSAVT